jgi:hypothetical protein
MMRVRAEKGELLVDCIGKTLSLWGDRPFSQCLFSRYSPKCSRYGHNAQLTVTGAGELTPVLELELPGLPAVNFAKAYSWPGGRQYSCKSKQWREPSSKEESQTNGQAEGRVAGNRASNFLAVPVPVLSASSPPELLRPAGVDSDHV